MILENLLFVCEGNTQRSPTFVEWFKENRKQYNVRSAGIRPYAPVILTEELLRWADVVYVMDLEQEIFIYREFPQYINKVIVIGCNDDYQRESKQLFKLIEYWAMKIGL